jgi:hypothetical protein
MVAVLPQPDHIVEANFFNTDDGPVWTNLTDYVEISEGLKAGKRRQNVFDDVAPATFAVYLDNSLGTFNNDKSTSPFVGMVNLDVPVRFRLRWPNCPSTTANMLGDTQSAGTNANAFTADQGTIDEDTATPPTGQTSDIIWSTGILDQVGVGVYTGVGPSRVPDDNPIYVKPNTAYNGRMLVKDDANGTGISFAVKGRIRWFDIDGIYISDSDSSSSTTLTTSYQTITVSGTSPANAHSARLGVVSQTIVAPSVRAISYNGNDANMNYYGSTLGIHIPDNAEVGDFVLAWVRTNNISVTVATPTGWTAKTNWADTRGKTWIFYRVVTATDPGKRYQFATSSNCGWEIWLTGYSGVHPTTLIHQFATATDSTFRTTHTTPNVTTTIASCWIVQAAFDVSSTTTSWGAPFGYNIRKDVYRTGGNSPTGIVADNGTAVVAGTYGSGVFTANASSKYASMCTLALAPATGTGPGTVTVQFGKMELVAGSLGTWAQGGHWESKFTGLVDSWQETFSGDLTLTEVMATDRQKQLTTITIGSAVYETIRSLAPIAYYKLDESSSGTSTTQEAGNSADVVQGTLAQKQYGTGGSLDWGQGVGPAIDGASAIIMNAGADVSNGVGLYGVLRNPVVNGNEVTLMTFWNSSSAMSGAQAIVRLHDATNGANLRCCLQIKGATGSNIVADALVASEAASYYIAATKSAQYFDGKTHLLAATFQLLGGQLISTLFIDGVQQAQGTVSCPLSQFPTLSVMGVGCGGSAAYLTAGTYSHMAVFDSSLNPSDIANINTAGTTAFAGDTIDQRIGRLNGWEGQGGLSLDATDTVCSRHMPDSQTLLAANQQAARSEGGTVYISGNGDVTFKSRIDKESTATPLITVTAQEVDSASFAKMTDDALLVNKPNVKRLDTQVITSLIDVVSKSLHGVHSKDFDTILSSNDDALNYATYVLAFYSQPKPRCDQVKLEALLMQDWANVLLIDMWQIIRISGLPATEQVTTLDLFIEGWEIDINQDSWSIVFDTSIAIPFGILNDATRGVCGAAVVGW